MIHTRSAKLQSHRDAHVLLLRTTALLSCPDTCVP